MMQFGKTWGVAQTLIGFTVIFGWLGIVYTWMYHPPQTTDTGILAILNQLTGAMGTAAMLVIGYYYGSSKGEHESKDAAKRSTEVAATAATKVTATLDRFVSASTGTGNGNGNGNGNGHGESGATKVEVTPPPQSSGVDVKTTVTRTRKRKRRKEEG